MKNLKTAALALALTWIPVLVEIRRRQADGRWLIAVHMLTPHP
jgi:hypothetical protein